MSTSLAVGRKAPAFSLPNQDGETVKLSSFKGRWVVLYSYPKDNTGGCTTQACEFTDSIKAFEKLDATVLGCSTCMTYVDTLTPLQRYIDAWGRFGCSSGCDAIICIEPQPSLCQGPDSGTTTGKCAAQ